jgi:DNA polymerase (family X)
MTKHETIKVLEEIAILLELCGENPFKARSYVNAARAIAQYEGDLEQLARDKRLRELKGIGQAIEQKLEELLLTGDMQYHRELCAKFPPSLFELFLIPNMGAKRIQTLYEELNITGLDELEQACAEGRLLELKGFGPKMQEKLLEGIAFARQHQGLFLYSQASRAAEGLVARLQEHTAVQRLSLAGSLRRKKETTKDIDLVASSADPESVMTAFVEGPDVGRVTGRGDTKSRVVLLSGIPADLRVVSDAQFPYALHHFTGSKDHNVAMRQRAKERGMKMNEYGLFAGDDLVPCEDEIAIFAALGLPYIPPELREDMGELDLVATPDLVDEKDLIGLFHVHTSYSDGKASLAEMVEGARARGYAYMVITDHSQTAAYAGGLRVEAVAKQHREIDALNATQDGFRILKGIESDIRMDGALDYEPDVLASFDLIIASVHSRLEMGEAEATARLVKAVENPFTTILGHPSGRLLLNRNGYPIDFDRLFDACASHRVAIEINANTRRLDLDWRYIKRAKDKGIKFVIGPDAHSVDGIDDTRYGVGIARKGWLEPADLLNCMSAEDLLAWKRKG